MFPYRTIERKHHLILLRLVMFRGDYFDDPRMVLSFGVADTNQTGIAFKDQ
jgi:hypothetical protein